MKNVRCKRCNMVVSYDRKDTHKCEDYQWSSTDEDRNYKSQRRRSSTDEDRNYKPSKSRQRSPSRDADRNYKSSKNQQRSRSSTDEDRNYKPSKSRLRSPSRDADRNYKSSKNQQPPRKSSPSNAKRSKSQLPYSSTRRPSIDKDRNYRPENHRGPHVARSKSQRAPSRNRRPSIDNPVTRSNTKLPPPMSPINFDRPSKKSHEAPRSRNDNVVGRSNSQHPPRRSSIVVDKVAKPSNSPARDDKNYIPSRPPRRSSMDRPVPSSNGNGLRRNQNSRAQPSSAKSARKEESSGYIDYFFQYLDLGKEYLFGDKSSSKPPPASSKFTERVHSSPQFKVPPRRH